MSCPPPLPDPLVELVAGRLRVIAEPTRIRLLDRLRDGEATVQQLTDMLDTTHQNVSKHLGLLHQAGLVTRRKDGTYVRYAIADASPLQVFEEVSSSVTRQLAQLAQLVAQDAGAGNRAAATGVASRPRHESLGHRRRCAAESRTAASQHTAESGDHRHLPR